MADTSTYSIFKLTFTPYMQGLASITPAQLEKAIDFLFQKIDSNIQYETGAGVQVKADKETVKAEGLHLAYIRIQRESQVWLSEEDTHAQKAAQDYPYINVLFDARHDDAIFVAIQHNKRFATPEVSSRGLKEYFNKVFAQAGNDDEDLQLTVDLQPMRLAKYFWSRLKSYSSNHQDLVKDLFWRVQNPCEQPICNGQSEAYIAMRYIAKTRDAIKAVNSNINFGFDENNEADIQSAERAFGEFVAAAIQNGYQVEAHMFSGKKFSSSQIEAATYALNDNVVGDEEEDSELPALSIQDQMKRMGEWFDMIYKEMKEIETINEQDGRERKIKS